MNAAPFEFGILAFSSLFAMVNPISAAPIFVELTRAHADRRRQMAIKACLAAAAALFLFATAGGAIFSFFGITVAAFKIVGGLIFTIGSVRELLGDVAERKASEDNAGSADPAIVPIGIPLIAGAGAISTVMMLSGQARDRLHQAALMGAIGVNIIVTLIVLLLAPTIVRKLGHSGQEILSKVMALLTAVIGVQFILDGGSMVIMQLMKK
jgi:multiple antibiotic resistance protein